MMLPAGTSGAADAAPEVVVFNGGCVCLTCHIIQGAVMDHAKLPGLVPAEAPCPRCGQPTRAFAGVLSLQLDPAPAPPAAPAAEKPSEPRVHWTDIVALSHYRDTPEIALVDDGDVIRFRRLPPIEPGHRRRPDGTYVLLAAGELVSGTWPDEWVPDGSGGRELRQDVAQKWAEQLNTAPRL